MKSEDPPVPILLIVFGSFVLIMFIPYYFNMKKTRSLHLLMNDLVAKGHDIPQELLFPVKRKRIRTDLHKGVILLAFGIGLCLVLFLTKVPDNYWTIGLIPVLVGVGYLILHKFGNSEINKPENK